MPMHDSPEHGDDDDNLGPLIPADVVAYYESGVELTRLSESPQGRLEYLRMQELILRYLPPAPATILDVGGGPGVYACWLASLGYEVHLIDPIELHIQQAQDASARQPQHPIASVSIGDARHLELEDGQADAILLLGPLYHIIQYDERAFALKEAYRVLRPGGVCFAAAISRFSSALDGMRTGAILDRDYRDLTSLDLADGQHRNPLARAKQWEYFATAYFHMPGDLRRELALAGLVHQATIGVEGPAWLLGNLAEYLEDPEKLEHLMATLKAIEVEPSLLGASAHILSIGQKPA
jgi:ubiquinone/menaquinone biosynthesis C-methylase UbiE